jgi:hypothetical protein
MFPLRAGGEPTGEQLLSTYNQLQWLTQIVARHCQNRLVEVVGAQKVPGSVDIRALVDAGIRRGNLCVPHPLGHSADPSARGGATSFASVYPVIDHPTGGVRLERRQFAPAGALE